MHDLPKRTISRGPAAYLRSCLVVSCLCLSVEFLGCNRSSNPDLTPVEGVVTLDGGPLPADGQGNVTFSPVDGQGNTATGLLDSSGHYRMSTFEPDDGVLPGSYKVTVIWASRGSGDPQTGVLKPPASMIPERYSNPETSGLTATVAAGDNPAVNFDLQP